MGTGPPPFGEPGLWLSVGFSQGAAPAGEQGEGSYSL